MGLAFVRLLLPARRKDEQPALTDATAAIATTNATHFMH
jgi:hypothetical protein